MALNLVQQRGERSVWDPLEPGWDTERWIAAVLASVFLVAGLRRRSPAGLFLTITGGSLAWWASSCAERRSELRSHVAATLPKPRRAADAVLEASEQSFPASDATALTPTTVS